MGREQRKLRRQKQRTVKNNAKKALKQDASPETMLTHLRELADLKPNKVHFASSPECTVALTRENGKEIVAMVDSTDVLFMLDDIDITPAIRVATSEQGLMQEISNRVGRPVSPAETQALAAVVHALNSQVGAA